MKLRLFFGATVIVVVAVSAAASGSGGVAGGPTWRVEPGFRGSGAVIERSTHATGTEQLGASVGAAFARERIERRSELVGDAAGQPRARVVVEADPGSAGEVAREIEAIGGRVEMRWGRLLQASVPSERISALTRTEGVAVVRPPAFFVPLGTPGEGVSATNVPAWQSHGLSGDGVKVAIFDGGFAGLADRQASGDIPASAIVADFCGGKAGGPEAHGTAVAEVVAEQAPGAQLFLICVDTDVSLGPALAYAREQGVAIINMSGGFYNTWRGDGSGPAGTPDAIVAAARSSGILWVNAAGNEARTHWAGTFTDADGDSLNEFVPGDEGITVEVRPGTTLCGFLRWDSWPVPSDDYDLGFVDPQIGLVAASVGYQIRDRLPPTEELCVTNVSGRQRFGAFVIARDVAASAPTFDLFVASYPRVTPIEHSVAARSVIDPATSPHATAVGAVCWAQPILETFSSQGPTIDGRIKPDVVAPDSVSSATYGPFTFCGVSAFAGTSASAPHVTGAAALLRERLPDITVSDLQAMLTKETLDGGAPGPDTSFGAGRLHLRELPQAILKAQPARGRSGTKIALRFTIGGAAWDVRHHVHVYRDRKQIQSFELPFAHAHQPWVRTVSWRAPSRSSAARYRFCVEGWDLPGHESTRSCAGISLRR